MSTGDNLYGIDTDYSSTTGDFAPTSGRIGGGLASNQAGRAALFKSPTSLFALANVDANGNQLVSQVNPAGNSLQVYTGQTAPAATSQFGSLIMGRQNAPSPTSYQPVLLDSQGAVLVSGSPKPSFRATAAGVTCGTSKVLLSLMNAGSNFIRVAAVNIYVQSAGTVVVNGGTLLGLTGTTSVTTYYPLFCEMYRINTHTKGASTTQLSTVACDSGDSLDTTVTCYTNSTISSSLGLLHRRDALQCTSTGMEFYRVMCGQTEKNILCRPGEGVGVVCVSNGTISANTNSGTTTATVDVEIIFSQASA